MATKNLNNDFMAKVLEDVAWKELSGDFAWNEQLLEKYKVEWKTLPGNCTILWTRRKSTSFLLKHPFGGKNQLCQNMCCNLAFRSI